MNQYRISRPATTEEIRIYHLVNEYAYTLNDEDYSNFVDRISRYVFEWRKMERRKAYQNVYRLARKAGVFVSDLVTWYCVDEP